MRAGTTFSVKRLAVLCVAVVSGCDATEERLIDVSSCAALDARGSLSITIADEPDGTIKLSGAREALEAVTIEPGETLSLDSNDGERIDVELGCGCPRRIQLLGAVDLAGSSCLLERLGVYGASRVAFERVSGESLDLRLAGAGQLAIDSLDAESVQLLASGASQTYLAGRIDAAEFDLGGTARLNAEALPAQNVTLRARGSADARVNATAHLYLERGGEASVENVGDGELTSL